MTKRLSAPAIRHADPAQAVAQQVLDTRVSKVVVLAQLCKYSTDLPLTNAEAPQRREELGLGVEEPGVAASGHSATVLVAEEYGPA